MLYGEVKIALINTYLAISEEKVTLMLVELDSVINATICIKFTCI